MLDPVKSVLQERILATLVLQSVLTVRVVLLATLVPLNALSALPELTQTMGKYAMHVLPINIPVNPVNVAVVAVGLDTNLT